MAKYIESCLAVYDLKRVWQFSQNDIWEYNGCFFQHTLSSGLEIICRADGLYIFDFQNCSFGKPVEYDEESFNGLFIRNQRIEVMHGFLACLRSETSRQNKYVQGRDMDFIDHHIVICRNDLRNIDEIILSADANPFSTELYMKACKEKLNEIKKIRECSVKNSESIIKSSIEIMDQVMSICEEAAYILGVLYRVAVYHKLGLEMHSTTFLRSIFEWLSRNQFPKADNPYEALLQRHNIEEGSDERRYMNDLKDLRGDSVHQLKFPQYTDRLRNPISKSFVVIQKIFCEIYSIDISIPLFQSQFGIVEERE